MKYLVFLLAFVLMGCDRYSEADIKAQGEARLSVFRECMELAAKMPRQADDDVSDVVEQCASSSYYMTNYITDVKATK